MKLTIPRSFQIKGKKWLIKFVEPEHHELMDEGGEYSGSTNIEERVIYLSKELRGEELEMVMMHELKHAALFESHLQNVHDMSQDTEEIICETFADLVVCVLKKYFYK